MSWGSRSALTDSRRQPADVILNREGASPVSSPMRAPGTATPLFFIPINTGHTVHAIFSRAGARSSSMLRPAHSLP